MSAPDIRALASGEHALIGDIIADAFHDDPVTLWTLGEPRLTGAVFAALAKAVYLKRGFGAVVSADGAAEGGGTLWLPPGAKKDVNILTTLSIAARVIVSGGVTPVRRALAVDDLMLARKPKEAHYYLFAIGVRAAQQGKGLGRALMTEPLARCDAEGMPAYLESSKDTNIPFYRSLGFEVVEELRLPMDGPTMWPMWRAPRASA